MKNIIKRILKEETEDKWDDLKSPEISISPRTGMHISLRWEKRLDFI